MIVQADHPGADLGQHGLDELAPGFGVGVGLAQGLLLVLQVLGHAVEGARQDRDLFRIVLDLDPGVEVAAGDAVGGMDQPGHRGGDTGGGRHAEPHRAHQHQQGGLQVAEGEGGLDRLAAGGGVAVVDQRGLGPAQQHEHAGLGQAGDVEIGIRIGAQTVEGAEQVLGFEGFGVYLAVGDLEGLGRRRDERRRIRQFGPGQHAAAAVDHIGGGKGVQRRQLDQKLAEADRRDLEGGRDVVHLARHLRHVRADVGLLVLDIGLVDLGRVLDHLLHARPEPVVDGAGDQGPEHHGHDDGRHHGHQGEQEHEAQMQPRARVARALEHQAQHPPPRRGAQEQDQGQVDAEDQQHRTAGRPDRTGARRRRRHVDRDGRQDRGHAPAQAKQARARETARWTGNSRPPLNGLTVKDGRHRGAA